jgi:ATP-dependent exoDNAse (exonuclease V) beta subunit
LYRRSFSAICVDEAQDMNNAQYQLLKVLANGVNHILMVGDPNQSIFHFNGSSPDYNILITAIEEDKIFIFCPFSNISFIDELSLHISDKI